MEVPDAVPFTSSGALGGSSSSLESTLNKPRPPQGYPKQILETEPEPKYLCGQCQLILKEPCQSYCGHRYCRQCLEHMVNNGVSQCSNCIQEGVTDKDYSTLSLDKSFPDNATKRELHRLAVRCSYKSCTWCGKFNAYEEHEKICAFRPWVCPRCSTEILESSKKEHQNKECTHRQIQCRYCKAEVQANMMPVHNRKCLKFPIKCQLCDDFTRKLPREKMLEHQETSCAKVRVFCEFGCFEAIPRNGQEEHNKQYYLQHQDFMKERITELEHLSVRHNDITALTKATGDQFKKIEDSIGALRTTATAVSSTDGASGGGLVGGELRKLQAIEGRVVLYDNVIGVLKMEVERSSGHIESLNRQRMADKEVMEAMERKTKSLERMIALKDVALAEQDLRIQSLEQTSYDGNLLWKITDFNRKRHDAKTGRVTSIYSPVFYTSRTGYKMCCRIYLNGDGMGKGNHISIFFVVMRGQFDALMTWPFKQKVTLMLLDQNNREHILDAFRPDANSSSFKRPTSEMNIASGCPLFMSLTQLDTSSHAYVKDDTIFIKVIIDCADLNH